MFRFFPIRVLFYQLYLLQLEEYSITRYLHLVKKTTGLPSGKTRKGIDWTKKLLLVFVSSLFLQILVCLAVSYFILKTIHPVSLFTSVFVVLFLLSSYVFFLFLVLSLLLITPLDAYLKRSIISKASAKVKKFPQLKVIGIAGSYGKTTMKEVLYAILSERFTVLKTPKNINTPVGISRVILKNLSEKTDILLLEMGEYYKNDIRDLCEIAKPDVGVITGINEAHLERMGSIDTTIGTIFELVENMDHDGVVVLNLDDRLVKENFQKYVKEQKVITYSSEDTSNDIEISNVTFLENAAGISFEMIQRGLTIGEFKVAVLGEYIISTLLGAIQLAQSFGLSINQIAHGISTIKPIEHRLQPIFNPHTKVMVIDDSYNGNPQGVKEAIKVLSRFTQHRRIYLTPGLVESGPKAKEIHYNIGKELSSVAGLVILIRNSVTPFIAQGLEDNSFEKSNILWFDTAKQAHASLGKILRAYDVILFQNDWPDNYI